MTEELSCPNCQQPLSGVSSSDTCPNCGALLAAQASQPHDTQSYSPRDVDETIDSDGTSDFPTLPPREAETDTVSRLARPALPAGEPKEGVASALDDVTLPPEGETCERPPVGTMVHYFGDYELLEEIARGGMGVVYKARQVKLNRIVALKMILAGRLASEGDVRRFYTEAEAAANLDHPGIVPIYEVGEHEGQHYFSMGFVDGQSLADRLKEGPLPPRDAAELTLQIAEAVAYAHEKGVIHRDLKPENVLLSGVSSPSSVAATTNDGQRTTDVYPKVTDFGLAKKLEGDSNLTGTGQILGTPSYMPPEQAAGQTDKIGPAADIYSLGAILYALLTGRPPFQAANVMDTMLQVLEKEALRPRQLDAGIPRDLETICLKCLEKDPLRRYGAASELANELRRFLNGEPIKARPLSPPARVWRWCKRKPVVAGLSAAVVLSLVVGTFVSTSLAVKAVKEADEATRQRETADEQRQRADIQRQRAEGQLWRSEWLLYANQIASAQREWETENQPVAWRQLDAARWDFRGWEHDYVFSRLTNPKTFRRPRHAGGTGRVAFSPDGRFIAGWGRGLLTIWDADFGVELKTLGTPSGTASDGIAYSPDGRRIVVAEGDTLTMWDVESGEEVMSLRGHSSSVNCVAFSPDGDQIVSGSLDDTVRVWDAKTGVELLNLKADGGGDAVNAVAFSPDGRRIASGSSGGLRIWDAESGQPLSILHGVDSDSLVFSSDGRQIVIGSSDGLVRLCDYASAEPTTILDGNFQGVDSLAFSSDGRRLAVVSPVNGLSVWDTESGEQLLTTQVDDGIATQVDDGIASVVVGPDGKHVDLFRTDSLSVAFSPDGKRIAITDRTDGRVRIRDSESGHELLSLAGAPARCFAFSPDGERIVCGHANSKLRVWDSRSGEELLAVDDVPNARDVIFSPDGERIVCSVLPFGMGSNQRQLRMWDARTGEEIRAFDDITAFAFSPDGKRIASANPGDDALRVWNAESGQELLRTKPELMTVRGYIQHIMYSPDGQWIRTVNEKTLAIRDADTGQLLLAIDVNQHIRTASRGSRARLAFSPDGRGVAGISPDGKVVIWRRFNADLLRVLGKHEGSIRSVAFSPDGRRIASGSKTIRVWDARSGAELHRFEDSGHCVAFSPDGRRVASSGAGVGKIWDAVDGTQTPTLQGYRDPITSVAVSTDGGRIVTGSKDGTAKIWDGDTGKLLLTLEGHTAEVLCVEVSSDDRRVASRGADRSVKVWDIDTGEELFSHQGPKRSEPFLTWPNGTYSLAFSPDGRRIAVAGDRGRWDRSIILDAESGQTLTTIPATSTIAYSPDGKRVVVSGSWPKVFDAESGAEVLTLGRSSLDQASSWYFSNPVWSPDGRWIACGYTSGGEPVVVVVWDASTGQQTLSFVAAPKSVWNLSLAFTADSRRIVGGMIGGQLDFGTSGLLIRNHTLKVWDRQSGKELLNLRGHPGRGGYSRTVSVASAVAGVAVSGDGEKIVSGGEDGTVKVWDASSGRQRLSFKVKGHTGAISSVAFSPDGQHVLTASHDGTLILWDAAYKEQLRTLQGHTDLVTSADFSSDGRWLVSGSYDQTVRIWDAETGRLVQTLKGHNEAVVSAAFSPDGRQIVSASGDQALKLWDRSSDPSSDTGQADAPWVVSADFSPNGRWIVRGSYDKKLSLWDAKSGNRITDLSGHTQPITCVAFDYGERLATGSKDKTIKIWNIRDYTATGSKDQAIKAGQTPHLREGITLRGHHGAIEAVVFGLGHVVSASDDGTLKLWRSGTGQELRSVKGAADMARALAAHHSRLGDDSRLWVHMRVSTDCNVTFSPDGRWLVRGSRDGKVQIWESETGKRVVTLDGYRHGIAFSPDGQRLACGSGNAIKVWDAAQGWESLELIGHLDLVRAVAFSRDGRRIVSGSDDNTLKVWDAEHGQELLTLKGHTSAVRCLAFSPDGRRIVSGSENGTLKFWDAPSGDWILKAKSGERMGALAFSPDGRQIAGGGSSGRLNVWDTATGQRISGDQEKTQKPGSEERLPSMRSLAYSPDGDRIVSGHFDGRLWIWNADDFQRLFAIEGHSRQVNNLAFSPDGRRIARASRDETIKVWDAVTGKEILTIHGDAGPVFGLAYSPDGRRIVSGAVTEPRALRVWDAMTGQTLLTLEGHKGAVIGVTFSPDGRWIASHGEDKTVRIWDAESGRQLRKFEASNAGERGFDPLNSGLSTLDFSPDGRWLVCGLDGTSSTQAWDMDSGRPLFTLRPRGTLGYTGYSTVVFSPDGKWIAKADDDGVDGVILWEVSRLQAIEKKLSLAR